MIVLTSILFIYLFIYLCLNFEPTVCRVHSEIGKDKDGLCVWTCSGHRGLMCSLNYKNSHCTEAGPGMCFVLCHFYFTNNVLHHLN